MRGCGNQIHETCAGNGVLGLRRLVSGVLISNFVMDRGRL